MSGLNGFNRLLLFTLGIAVAAAGVICLLVVTGAVETGTLALSGWFREQFQHLAGLSGNDETAAIVASAAAIFCGLLLALIQMIPGSAKKTSLVAVTDPNGNTVMMSPESIRQIVEQAAMQVPGVIRANAVVRDANGDGIAIVTSALLQPDVHIVEKSNELNDKIRNEMQNRVGVKVASLRLNLELARGDEAEKPRRGPLHWGDRREKISTSR